jgi:MFS family permease
MLGLPLGLSLSYAVSGAVAQVYGWRAAFLVAGAPGLIVGVLCLTLREPRRGGAEPVPVGAQRRPGAPLRLLIGTPTFVLIALSGALHNFNLYALSTFLPAFLTRSHGLDLAQAGALTGLSYLAAGLGLLLGGIGGDWAAGRWASGRLLLPAACLAAAVPCLVVFLLAGHAALAVAALGLGLLLLYVYYAPVYAALQDVVEPTLRGTAMATYFLAMYLLGASLGPVAAGALSDLFAAQAAAAAGAATMSEAFRAEGLQRALFVVPVLTLPLALVVLAAARTLPEDRRRISEWMARAAAS